MSSAPDVSAHINHFRESFERIQAEIGKEVVGYRETVRDVLICLFSQGHVLLEGVPGLGKTLLVRTLAKTVNVDFSRIQFTPDLMPADIVGTNVMFLGEDGSKEFRFQRGPLFANVVLADEINRATPKTQSALLEAMQEHRITVGGTTRELPPPFFVLGTQNPIEMEGTYPLPEAQLDRFLFKLTVDYLGEDDLVEVIDRTTASSVPSAESVIERDDIARMQELVREVAVADHVKRYAVRLGRATQPGSDVSTEMVRRYAKVGSSPRGIQALIVSGKVRALLDGRPHLSCEDVRTSVLPALRHRILLNFEGEAEEITTDSILAQILEQTPENPGR